MSSKISEPHILLLTGTPGIGKTTLLRSVAAQLQQFTIGGFYTEEIREFGQRKGFRLLTFKGEQGVIAHVNFNHHYHVSKYGVDVTAIEHFADVALTYADEIDVYLIDEIGKMECFSQCFVSRVEALLASDKPVIATVAKKGGGLIEEAKQWPDSQLWQVTHSNRDALVTQVVEWLHKHLHS